MNEADLHARHRWLVETGRERMERCLSDPEYFDAKVAGWWVSRPEWNRFKLSAKSGSGALREGNGKLPAIAGRDAGRGAYAKSRSTPAKPTITRKRPALTGNGGGNGVNAPGLGCAGHRKRPVLQYSEGGRVGFHARTGGLYAYMQALSDRLRRVRVCAGDFERLLGPAVTTCIGTTGVFLDPPYPLDGRAVCYSHDSADVWWRSYQWAIDNGDNLELRIALCGYEHPGAVFPPDWEEVAWKASGGYGRSARGQANARRERIWF